MDAFHRGAVSQASVVGDRYARWANALWKHGYRVERHPKVGTSIGAGTVGLRGRRRSFPGVPSVVVDIVELWLSGADPDGLKLAMHGCHLFAAGWHAQIAQNELGAERLDVDRAKSRRLMIHRHPFGRPNDVREPEALLFAPEAWMVRVEECAAEVSC
jgi:hypothetical protein